MSAGGPFRRAPDGVPPEAAFYLDAVAERLGRLAEDLGLELKTYDQYDPKHAFWQHALYGTTRDRQFCIQVVASAETAPESIADLRAHIRLYPSDGRNAWLFFRQLRVQGMTRLVAATAHLTRAVRFTCAWRMPHPTDPDPKA